MKGVFIKHCKFPINCTECPCMYGGICFVRPPEVDGLIADNVEELYKKGGKPDWCPIVEAEIEPVTDNWISIKDKLPDKGQRVLVFYKALGQEDRVHNDVMATNWRTEKGNFIPCNGYKVTHWQPLPEPPKGE